MHVQHQCFYKTKEETYGYPTDSEVSSILLEIL